MSSCPKLYSNFSNKHYITKEKYQLGYQVITYKKQFKEVFYLQKVFHVGFNHRKQEQKQVLTYRKHLT
jgi:hypothetical protein